MLTSRQNSSETKSVNTFLLALFKWNLGRSIFGAIAALFLTMVLIPVKSFAATATYHLHNEASSTSGLKQLTTASPDATVVALSTVLTNKAVAEYLVYGFDTQAGVPNAGGVIASGSSVTFTIWMNKTASAGTVYPRAKLYLNSASGTQLCTATGTTALTTTLTKYSLSCTTSSAITMATTDRFYLWTGVNLTKKSTSTFSAVVEIEGTLNGNYDSLVVVPLPTAPAITTLSPASGPMGTSVTITGTNFGTTQGTSSVTFNGLTATTNSWSTTSIVSAVPTGATTGPVVVTVGGYASNGVSFTVTLSISSLTPNSGGAGTIVTIAGAQFGTTQGTSTVTFNGLLATTSSWSDTRIIATAPVGVTTGPVVVTVGGVSSNGLTFTLAPVITFINPPSESIGAQIYIAGARFGATQGSSTVYVNGKLASIYSWSDTQISFAVPSGASQTIGPVIVTVGGISSNPMAFSIILPSLYITTAAGNGVSANSGDGGAAAVSGVAGPYGIASDGIDKIYLTTGTNIRQIDKFGIITSIAGTGVYGYSGDGGPATSALIDAESGIAVDKQGNIYFSGGVNNNLYVRKIDTNGIITTIAGTGVSGFSGDGGPAISAQISPLDVAVDNNGNIYITDKTSRIRKIDTAGIISTIAGTGVAGYSGDGGPATAAQLNQPQGIKVDINGNIYIADTVNNCIRKIDTAGMISTVAGTGVAGNSGDGGPAINAQLSSPKNMIVDFLGNIFIADYGWYVIKRVDPSGIITTIAGTGSGAGGFSGDGGPATSAFLRNPSAIVLDQFGNVLFADGSNYRVRKIGAGSWGNPYISNITPTYGVYGTSVNIKGSYFGSNSNGLSSVKFNGLNASPAGNLWSTTNWSNTSITVPVPSGATSGPVTISVYLTGTSNGINFTIPAAISSISPSSGIVGTSVTISGSSFGATQGTSTITFNGTIGSPTSWSNTSITVPVPLGASTGPVVVALGSALSNSVNFTVLPHIDSLTPTSGLAGTLVAIAGSGFGSNQGTSSVTFNGLMAVTSGWSDTTILATVPSGITNGPVVVTVGGNPSNGINFSVPLSISSLSPSSGPVGTSVTITGTSFGATQAGSTVTFNGLAATVSSWSNNSIAVTVPAGASSGPVVVTVGGTASSSIGFTVPLYINTISPMVGSPGTSVTITGSSFGMSQGTSTVTFNGTLAIPTSWSDNSVVIPVPSGATTGPVVVTVGGIASNGIVFSVSPQINSLSPQTGLIGTSITISGARFGVTQGTSTVIFNGTVATPTSWSDTSIVVPVPTGATTGPVVVTVGGVPSSGVTFTVLQITITYPTPGMVLNQPSTVVYGTLPTITGDFTVVVNGRYAMINGQDFAINNVDLALGQNTLTVTLTDQAGESTTGSVTVQSNSQNAYVQLSSGLEQSLAPMSSTLTLGAQLPSSTITQTSLTVSSTDLGVVVFPYQVAMPTPGIYIATVTATTSNFITYQDKFAFNVLDPVATENLLKSTWNNMQTALLGGNVTGALDYFTGHSQADYQAIFNNLQPLSIQQIFTTLEGFNLLSITNFIAEGEALRTENGVLLSYPVFFMLDETGTWRISSF